MTDGLERLVAGRLRVPGDLRKFFRAADRLVEHAAALLGLHTHAANSYQHTAWRDDGATYTRKLWGVTPRPY